MIGSGHGDGGARATPRDWWGLAVLALPCILYSMDLTVLNLALPQLTAALAPTSVEFLWIVDIYGFVLAGALIPMGVLGDRIGRRRLLMIGAAAFGLASIMAAAATSVPMLIVARAMLGLAAATLAPSTLSLITHMFRNPGQRTFAIGVWIASFSSGAAIGPLLGGVVLAYFWWGAVFLLNVPVMLLLLGAAPRLLPEARDPAARLPDLASAALTMVSVLAIVLAIKLLALTGPTPTVAAAVGIGLLFGAAFVARQRRLADPLIDLGLFRSLAFRSAVAINLLGFFIAFGSFLLIAQHLQLVLGLSPLRAGMLSAPSGLAFILGALATPRLARAIPPSRLVAAGLLVAALGLGLVGGHGQDLTRIVTGYVVLSLGLAPVFTLTTDLIVSAAPPEKAGSAAGIAETSSELGGALGIALLGSLAASRFRAGMGGEVAGDTLGGVVALSERMPADQGVALLAAARAAFVSGFQIAIWSAAALALAGMAAAMVVTQPSADKAPDA